MKAGLPSATQFVNTEYSLPQASHISGVLLLSSDLEQPRVDPHRELAESMELCEYAVQNTERVLVISDEIAPWQGQNTIMCGPSVRAPSYNDYGSPSVFVQTEHAYEVPSMGSMNRRCHLLACEIERVGASLNEMTCSRDRLKVALQQAHAKLHRNGSSKKITDNSILVPQNSRSLQEYIDRINDQWERKLAVLQTSSVVIQDEYEAIIEQLTARLSRNTSSDTSPMGSDVAHDIVVLLEENRRHRDRICLLESRIESMKEVCLSKGREMLSSMRDSSLLVTQRFVCIRIEPESTLESSRGPSNPPAPTESSLTYAKWNNLLHMCVVNRSRKDMQRDMHNGDTLSDQIGLIDTPRFTMALGHVIDDLSRRSIIEAYRYSEELVDYKTFLSDLATRCGVFAVDLEQENETLRMHVASLMRELNAEMVALEDEEDPTYVESGTCSAVVGPRNTTSRAKPRFRA